MILKQYSDSKKNRKMKVLLFFNLLIVTGSLMAGPPFGTDDPEPVDFRHWEYYLSSMDNYQPGFVSGTLPHVEINYGIIHGGQFHLVAPVNFISGQDKEFRYGYSNTELGFKYRFYESRDHSVQVGVFPVFEVPTIKNSALGGNYLQVYLPVWFQKSWGRLTTYGGGGYWINPGTGNKNWVFTGWELQYDLSKYFTIGGELFYRTPADYQGHSFVGTNIGGFVNFSDKIHFLYSFGHSITKDRTFMSYAGILITI